MRAQPLRVLVWASSPALRAGLSELARDEGFEVAAELSSVAGLEATDVAADVIVADIDDAGSAQDVLRLAGVARAAVSGARGEHQTPTGRPA